MSLYDGLSVETAPIPEISQQFTDSTPTTDSGLSGWSSSLKLMASQIQRNKKASKATQQKFRPQPSTAVLEPTGTTIQSSLLLSKGSEMSELYEDDLAVELMDEYDPMVPNNYELVVKERREKREKEREEERKRPREDRGRRNRGRRRSDSNSDSDEERSRRSKRKDTAAIPPPASLTAIPPPASLATSSQPVDANPPEEKNIVESALEELSRTKAQKVNPFAKPKFGSVASQIMNKYGWKEGQGLGKLSQGISTALAVEKTSKRGGKIVNVAAEIEVQLEQEKKKAQSLAEVMRNPSKVILLQNMVGPGEVDDDLQPEVIEECSKYGEVNKCLIFEIPEGAVEEEAVRIFVEFTRLESAIKAIIDLNGRFFGGRIVKGGFFSEDRFARYDLAPQPTE